MPAQALFAKMTDLPVVANESGGDGPGVATQDEVDVVLLTQEERQWCWAATAQAVADFKGVTVDQEDIATDHIQASGRPYTCAPPNRTDQTQGGCATNGCTTACNGNHSLRAVLDERGDLQTVIRTGAAIDWADLKHQISHRHRPVPCRIQWVDAHGAPAGGHFVCLFGWREDASGDRFVFVYDPLFPGFTGQALPADRREILFDDFCQQYPLNGAVGGNSHSYAVT